MTRTVSPSPEQTGELADYLRNEARVYAAKLTPMTGCGARDDGYVPPKPEETTFWKAADALESTQAEIARLTTALEFYAYGIGYTEIEDGGETARAALKDSPNVG